VQAVILLVAQLKPAEVKLLARFELPNREHSYPKTISWHRENVIFGPPRSGSAEIPVYVYSRFGYVLAEIIEGLDPNKREKANNEMYDWFQIIYRIKEDSPSTIIFYAHLFKKCKEKGQFEFIVTLFRKVINSNILLKNMFDLFNEALLLIFNYPGRTDPFHIILNEIWEN
jgi:hypothetical protein